LQNTEDAAEHARMMILLQRTQELDVCEWRAIREEAYDRFGKAEYNKLLQTRTELAPEVPKGSIPKFERKKAIFVAMKEEQDGLTPEWEERLPAIYDALSSGQNEAMVLRELVHLSEEEKKMRHIRKAIQSSEAEWNIVVDQMYAGTDLVEWLEDWNLPEEIKSRCSKVVTDVCAQMEEKMQEEPVQTGMKLIPELLARWDWYTKRQLETRQPIIEQWKLIKPWIEEFKLPRNYRPGLPEELKVKRPDMMVVEIWYQEWDTKTRRLCLKSKSEVIWDMDWDDNAEFHNWYQRRWCECVAEKRHKQIGPFRCFSPLRWFGTDDQQELEPVNDTCPIELVREWPVVWLGYESDEMTQRIRLWQHYKKHWEVKRELIENDEVDIRKKKQSRTGDGNETVDVRIGKYLTSYDG
jgi:hypothetical protein